MTQSIGIDLVDVSRIQADIDRYGDRFIARMLSARERETLDGRVDKAVFVAGRFACKEAIIKALGSFITDRPAYVAIEIINDAGGQPVVNLPGEVMQQLGARRVMVSISHEKSHAVAMAVIAD